MPSRSTPPRAGRRYIVLVFIIMMAAGGWTALWAYASSRAQQAIEAWRAHEAAAGRVFGCGGQEIGGYPFRIEVTCTPATAEFRRVTPAAAVSVPRIHAAAQIYQPGLMIGEFEGPVRIGEAGKPAQFEANWSLAQASVRGLPTPERVSLVFDRPRLDRFADGRQETLFDARHLELHGRPAAPDRTGKPAIETGLRLQQASFPTLPAQTARPIDAVIDAVLRGVSDFEPKPWRERLRELQASGGRIEITRARVQQGNTIAVGTGALTISPAGYLDGELRVTVAGLDDFLHAIGADQKLKTSPAMDKLAGALDRLAPGLGNVAREKVSANIGNGIGALGQPAELDGKRAVSLPLRFDNGAVFLGPLPLGHLPALL
jgi:hypothetical protein